jgi:hypothetical protein
MNYTQSRSNASRAACRGCRERRIPVDADAPEATLPPMIITCYVENGGQLQVSFNVGLLRRLQVDPQPDGTSTGFNLTQLAASGFTVSAGQNFTLLLDVEDAVGDPLVEANLVTSAPIRVDWSFPGRAPVTVQDNSNVVLRIGPSGLVTRRGKLRQPRQAKR